MIKKPPAMRETWVQSLDWEDPLEEGMATHSRILQENLHGQRSLAGNSPWARKEPDTTERLSTAHRTSSCEIESLTARLLPLPLIALLSSRLSLFSLNLL